MKRKKVVILLVEDNPGDIRLTKEAFSESKFNNELYVVGDGEEAMDFLQKKGKHKDAVTPDMVLLDLNLPKKDGKAVLAEIREDKRLTHMPVVVLTTSKEDADIMKMYDLQASCYVQKPLGPEQFVEAVKKLKDFWIEIVSLPES